MKEGYEKASAGDLARHLGLLTATMVVIGSVIGSGIFKKPALMSSQLHSPELLLAVWVIAGMMTLFGALTNAEIGGMMPAAGGQYVYFNRIYNGFVGYLYGWASFAVIQTGSIASISYVFSEYLGYFFAYPHFGEAVEKFSIPIPLIGRIFPLADVGTKTVAILAIVALTAVNYVGVRFGGFVQNVLTFLKVAAIAALVLLSFTIGHGDPSNFTSTAPLSHFHGAGGLVAALLMAMSGAFWAYDGWNNVTWVAGEIRQPQRNLPRALILGTAVIVGIYVVTNLAYLYVLPVETMAKSKLVAADVAEAFLGGYGGAFIAAAVMVSTLGAANGSILASARIFYAMAKEKTFFRRLADVHPAYRTPGPSLVVQGAWSSILVLSGTFDQLTDMLIFVSWIFYAMGAFGVFVLRRKMADAVRPYRVWGYPVIPALFVVFAAVFVGFTVYNDIAMYARGEVPIINSLMGLLLVVIGIPFYVFWRRKAAGGKPA
jgi:APA family basic amino acid/polyamine antiporter